MVTGVGLVCIAVICLLVLMYLGVDDDDDRWY